MKSLYKLKAYLISAGWYKLTTDKKIYVLWESILALFIGISEAYLDYLLCVCLIFLGVIFCSERRR